MGEFIARENIRRFKAQLQSSIDDAQRAEIEVLLEEERRRLREIRQGKASSPRPA